MLTNNLKGVIEMPKGIKGSGKVKDKDKVKDKGGRPRIYDSDILADQLKEYIDKSDDPMIEEFVMQNGVTKDTLYRLEKENQRLSDIIKYCHTKQHIRTVRRIEEGLINPTFGIFKLKQRQYGWTDKQEVELSGELNIIKVTPPKIDED